MTPDALRATLSRLGLTSGAAARLLGVEDRTVRRYLDGSREIPPPVVRLIRAMDEKPADLAAWLSEI